MKKEKKPTQKNNNKKNASKSKIKILRILLITALAFFILGFSVSYLYNTKKLKNSNDNNRVEENTKDNKENIADSEKENANTNTNTVNNDTDKDTGINTNTEDSNTDKKTDTESGNDGKGTVKPPDKSVQVPVNPQKPNVEKINVEALEKLDNTKYSWWIKLNKEHKTPQIPDDIKKLIDKHDGIYVGDTSTKNIYLTFDEGYENGYTSKILDVLKDNDVKTIFFVTSSYIERNTELVQRMVDEGHQVGNHTITHPSLPDLGYEKLEHELLGLDKQFYEKFGTSFKYMRPPAGEYSERTLAAAKQLGYKTIFWSFAYDDWYADKIRGADYAYNKVMENLHNGAILLLHAVSKDNADALDKIIKDIKSQGYELPPFDL